ncbi:hypothetical protein HWV62_33189 [Athelia sp. TMB]|nr:hypothetical protein HWV62_33189 [Athelia sp. TMB]
MLEALTPSQITALYTFGRFQYTYGNYSGAADYLYHFRIPSTDTELLTSAQWGKLFSDILTGKWGVALELNTPRDAIDARDTSSANTGQGDGARAQLHSRTWLAHWCLFVCFNHSAGRTGLLETFLAPTFLAPTFLATIQTACPWIVRYLAAAAVLARRSTPSPSNPQSIRVKPALNEIVKGLEQATEPGQGGGRKVNLIRETRIRADTKIDLEKGPTFCAHIRLSSPSKVQPESPIARVFLHLAFSLTGTTTHHGDTRAPPAALLSHPTFPQPNAPAKGFVVDPIIKADKEADIDRKIRLYGVIEAFRQGNAQIDETLRYFATNSLVDVNALSLDSKKLIQDARDIIETARVMVQEKNADKLFQSFVWHTRAVDVDAAKKYSNDVLPVDKEKAKDDGQLAVQNLRTILSLVLTNSEVRKLLSDFSLIGRDLLARGASNAADGLRPDQQALANVDQSAPNDQFITEGGRAAGPNQTPVLEARVSGTDHTVTRHLKDDLGTGATVKTADGADKDKSSVVKVDTLKFSIRDSKHDFLYKTLKPLAPGLVKKQIQKAIRDAITTGMEYVDEQLFGVCDRYAAAKATEGTSRAQVPQDTFAQKKDDVLTTASQAQAKASQFKVVHNKRNSILSNSGHPAGWVNRTTEREDAAVKGQD